MKNVYLLIGLLWLCAACSGCGSAPKVARSDSLRDMYAFRANMRQKAVSPESPTASSEQIQPPSSSKPQIRRNKQIKNLVTVSVIQVPLTTDLTEMDNLAATHAEKTKAKGNNKYKPWGIKHFKLPQTAASMFNNLNTKPIRSFQKSFITGSMPIPLTLNQNTRPMPLNYELPMPSEYDTWIKKIENNNYRLIPRKKEPRKTIDDHLAILLRGGQFRLLTSGVGGTGTTALNLQMQHHRRRARIKPAAIHETMMDGLVFDDLSLNPILDQDQIYVLGFAPDPEFINQLSAHKKAKAKLDQYIQDQREKLVNEEIEKDRRKKREKNNGRPPITERIKVPTKKNVKYEMKKVPKGNQQQISKAEQQAMLEKLNQDKEAAEAKQAAEGGPKTATNIQEVLDAVSDKGKAEVPKPPEVPELIPPKNLGRYMFVNKVNGEWIQSLIIIQSRPL